MKENEIYTKLKYKCAICGEIYDSIADRVNCEQTCLKKYEEEQKKLAEQIKNAEKERRKTEVVDSLNHSVDLLRNYIKDYGNCDFSDHMDDSRFIWPSKLWHHFWN